MKKLNKNEIFEIIKSISSSIPEDEINEYLEFLCEKLIEIKTNEDMFFILVFFMSNDDDNYLFFQKYIKSFNEKNIFTHIELKQIKKEEDLLKEFLKYQKEKILKVYIIKDDIQDTKSFYDIILKNDIDFEIKSTFENMNIPFNGIYFYKSKDIIINYILRHYANFSGEGYLDGQLLYRKIIYDIKNLEEKIPIKLKEINEDIKNVFIGNLKNMIDKLFSTDLIINKSKAILSSIKKCIGKKLFDCMVIKQEKAITILIKKNLKKISEHIICYSMYQQFFKNNLFYKIQEKND